MRGRVSVGSDFEVEVKTTDASSRKMIVGTVCAVGGFFLVGSALMGVLGNDFHFLNTVWNVVGPLYGGCAGYFFTRERLHIS